MDPFIRSMDMRDKNHLFISGNNNWISVHPVVLSMISSLGANVGRENIEIEDFEPRSLHYLDKIGLFRFLGMESNLDIKEHDPSGRFIPISRIANSDELMRFI